MRTRCLILLLPFLIALPAFSQCATGFTEIVATKVVDQGNNSLTSGTVIVTAEDVSGRIPNYRGGGGTTVTKHPATGTVIGGAIESGLCVPSSDQTTPVGILYHIVITDNSASGTNAKVYDVDKVYITGTTFSLDTYTYPNTNTGSTPTSNPYTGGNVNGDFFVTGTVFSTFNGLLHGTADSATHAASAAALDAGSSISESQVTNLSTDISTASSNASSALSTANAAVKRAGDSMTGALILSGDPTLDNQAATKHYVDTVSATAAGALPLAGGTMNGPITLAADPSSALQATTKQYVDNNVTTLNASITNANSNASQALATANAALPLGGGVMTGPIQLAADPTISLQASTKQYVDNSVASVAVAAANAQSAAAGAQSTANAAQTSAANATTSAATAQSTANSAATAASAAQTTANTATTAASTAQTTANAAVKRSGDTMAGALVVPQLNGSMYASQYQSTPGAYNGLANAFSACGSTSPCYVLADPTYGSTALYGGPADTGGMNDVNTSQQSAVPNVSGMLVQQDYRYGAPQTYILNPATDRYGASYSGIFAIKRSHAPLYSNSSFPNSGYAGGSSTYAFYDYFFAGGWNMANNVKYNHGGVSVNLLRATTAQDGGAFTTNQTCLSPGDCVANVTNITTVGSSNGSDEGAELHRGLITENANIPHGNISSISAAATNGTVAINPGFFANGSMSGDSRFLVNLNPTKMVYAGTIASQGSVASGQYFYGSQSAAIALTNSTPSNWSSLGTSSWTTLTQAVQPNLFTSTAQMPTSNVSFTVANGTVCAAGQTAIIFDSQYWEYIQIASVSGNTWTASQIDKYFEPGAAVACGGPVGYGIWSPVQTQEPNAGYPIHAVLPVVGYDGTSLYVASIGGQRIMPTPNLSATTAPTIASPTFSVTMTGGALTAISHTGATQLNWLSPLDPQLIISGLSGCTTAPFAHVPMMLTNGTPLPQESGTDVIDNAGSGCTGTASATFGYLYQPPTLTPVMSSGALSSVTVSAGSSLGNNAVEPLVMFAGGGCTAEPWGHLTISSQYNVFTATGFVVDYSGSGCTGTPTPYIVDGRTVGISQIAPTTYVMAPVAQIQSVFSDATKTAQMTLEPMALPSGVTWAVGDQVEEPNWASMAITRNGRDGLQMYTAANGNGGIAGFHAYGSGFQGPQWFSSLINEYQYPANPFSSSGLGYGSTAGQKTWPGGYELGGAMSEGFILSNAPQNSGFLGLGPTVVGVACNAQYGQYGVMPPCAQPNYDITQQQPFNMWLNQPLPNNTAYNSYREIDDANMRSLLYIHNTLSQADYAGFSLRLNPLCFAHTLTLTVSGSCLAPDIAGDGDLEIDNGTPGTLTGINVGGLRIGAGAHKVTAWSGTAGAYAVTTTAVPTAGQLLVGAAGGDTTPTSTFPAAITVPYSQVSGTPAQPLAASVSIGGSSIATGCTDTAVTVSGATASMVAAASPAGALATGWSSLEWSAYVSAANTAEVHVCNWTGAAVATSAMSFNVRVIP